VNGNTPGQYVAAWRHVHDIFTAVGANNITWVWSPNIASNGNTAMSELYPGDAYVDWTGLDAYNKYGTWQSFGALLNGGGLPWLQNSYKELLAVAPAKPVMLAEFASLEAGDGGAKKAAWITDALTSAIPAHFPAVKAVVWFNWNSDAGSSYIVESSAASRAAFSAAIRTSTYAANTFGSLPAGTKIKPLGAAPSSATTGTTIGTVAPTDAQHPDIF
jgi:beta-mannanase